MINLEIRNLTKQKVSQKELIGIVDYLAKYLNLSGDLSLVLAGDGKLRSLNRKFRGIDKSTDVLTFSAPKSVPGFLGEIFINLNDCRRIYKYREVFDFEISSKYLLFFLLIHGLLHLAGDNDEKDKERIKMIERGKNIMKLLVKNAIIKLKF